jgi:5-methylcytosine-specific restriction endonuclease McrA
MPTKRRSRPGVPIATQVKVLFRDRWLCSLCHEPTIFAAAMRLAGLFVQGLNYELKIAYHDPQWRRDSAPLLDELGCVIDHVVAFSKGGPHDPDNFATACNKCNGRKSAAEKARYLKKNPPKRIRAKFGEPAHWDGLSSLFVVLARAHGDQLTPTERIWLRELESYIQKPGESVSGPGQSRPGAMLA